MDWLRAKGLGKAGKLGEREATEGAVEALVDGNVGVIVELNCNTDFVAKGADFTGTVAGAREARRRRTATPTSRRCRSRARRWARPCSSSPPSSARTSTLGRVVRFETDPTACSTRTSTSRTTAAPSACSSSSAASTRRTPTAQEVAHEIALHVVVRRARLPHARGGARGRRRPRAGGHRGEEPQRGRARGEARRARSQGRLNAFYKDVVLLEQAFGEGPEGLDRQAGRGPRLPARTLATVRPRQGGRGSSGPPDRRVEEGTMAESRFRRVVLKLSGEAFAEPGTALRHRRRGRAAHRRGDRAGTPRARRRDRGRRRRRQHLARACRRDARAWTAPAPTTWACSAP